MQLGKRIGAHHDRVSVYVYDLTTATNDLAGSSDGAIRPRILNHRTEAHLTIWSIVATAAQAVVFRSLPGVISARLRGTMVREGNELGFVDSTTEERLTVSVGALEQYQSF